MRGRTIAIIVVVLVVVFAGVAHGTYQWGFNTGNTKGYQTGYTKGDTDGQNVGYYKGFNEGQQKGYTNGQAAVEKQAMRVAITRVSTMHICHTRVKSRQVNRLDIPKIITRAGIMVGAMAGKRACNQVAINAGNIADIW
jgi:hypothetical protein